MIEVNRQKHGDFRLVRLGFAPKDQRVVRLLETNGGLEEFPRPGERHVVLQRREQRGVARLERKTIVIAHVVA